MYRRLLFFLILFFPLNPLPSLHSLNLDFENVSPNQSPIDWYTEGSLDTRTGKIKSAEEEGFKVIMDSNISHSGKYSLLIKSLQGGRGGSAREDCLPCIDSLVNLFHGKVVTYSGWIKTEHVSRWAGLWLRLDADHKVLYFNNMYDSAISGTRDWKKYSFTFSFSDSAKDFDFGVIMGDTTEGKAWFDDLSLDISPTH